MTVLTGQVSLFYPSTIVVYCYRYPASHVGGQKVNYKSAGSGSRQFLDKLLTVYKN